MTHANILNSLQLHCETSLERIIHMLGLVLWDGGLSAEHPASNRFYWLLTHHSMLSYFHCVISDRSRPSKTSLQALNLCVCMCVVWEVLRSQAAVCGCVSLLNKSAGFYTRRKMEELLWNTLGLSSGLHSLHMCGCVCVCVYLETPQSSFRVSWSISLPNNFIWAVNKFEFVNKF